MSNLEIWLGFGLMVALTLLLISLVYLRQARRDVRSLRTTNAEISAMVHNVSVTHSKIRFAIMDMLEESK